MVFPSALGWFALLGRDGALLALTFAHAKETAARAAMAERLESLSTAHEVSFDAPVDREWSSELRLQLQRFAEGEPVEFADCALALPPMTDFQRRVVAATRRLRYGETASYGEVARRAGRPGAARAVGTVMKSNLMPVVIPCHRVVGSGGLGGYSAPQGLVLKRSLLDMEAAGLAGT